MCRSGSRFLLMTLGGVSQAPSQAFTDSQPMCPEQDGPVVSPETTVQGAHGESSDQGPGGPMVNPQTRVQGAPGDSSDSSRLLSRGAHWD